MDSWTKLFAVVCTALFLSVVVKLSGYTNDTAAIIAVVVYFILATK